MSSLVETLGRIDALKARWDAVRPLPAQLQKQLHEDWEITLTYHSNAIEGNTLSLGETKAILLNGITISGKGLREHLEVINHREAMRLMSQLAAQHGPLLESEILGLHQNILLGIQSEDAGKYRDVRVRVAGSMRVFPNPAKVPELMQEFVRRNNDFVGHVVVCAALAHYELVAIHPFADGNGRTARLLMNLLLLRQTYPPTLLPIDLRGQYYDVLEAANNGDTTAFLELIAEQVEASLARVLAVVE